MAIDQATRRHYAALYPRPHAIHDAFEQFGAFTQDAADNKALLAKGGKLTMPVIEENPAATTKLVVDFLER